MPSFQPRMTTDPVWWSGSNVNTFTTSTGLGIHITALQGWDERVDVRDVREARPGQDGEYADNVFLGGRTITISGDVYGSSWVDLQARKRALMAVFTPRSVESLLKVPDPATASPTLTYADTGMTGYERVSARVIESIVFGDMHGPAAQSFQVIVRASDPRVYSDVVTSTDSGTTGTAARTVAVDQAGSYDTPVTLTVTGPTGSAWAAAEPSSGLNISATGLALTSDETATLGVDTRAFTATVGYQRTRELFVSSGASLAGLWLLGETSGTTADNAEGTSARDGTYAGGYTLNQTGPLAGTKSVALNGTTGYISIPSVPALYPAKHFVEVWVNFDTVAGTQVILDNITGNFGVQLSLQSGVFRVKHGVTTPTTVSAGTPLGPTAGVWYRLFAYFGFGTGTTNGLKVFNTSGDLVTSVGLGYTHAPATAGGYRLGSTLAGANFTDGNIGAAAIWSCTNANVYGDSPENPGAAVNVYSYLDASYSRWANLGTDPATYTLASSGLATGSKLNVSYRDARL